MYETLETTLEAGVATMTLNRPAVHNAHDALNTLLLRELSTALRSGEIRTARG